MVHFVPTWVELSLGDETFWVALMGLRVQELSGFGVRVLGLGGTHARCCCPQGALRLHSTSYKGTHTSAGAFKRGGGAKTRAGVHCWGSPIRIIIY